MAPTLDQIIRRSTQQLAASSPSPRLDAEVLVMHVTGHARAALITHAQERLSIENEEQLQELLARRAHGEPIAYLIGKREFWSLDLRVTPDVLIPRPETELLVEQALMRIPPDSEWTIADLGTGSGAVALAIAKERPRCRVIATDICATALALAQTNAIRLAITNVEFRLGEWLDPFAGERLDIIVSNPPYIAEHDPHLAQGDVRFEPRAALVAGADGLDAIRVIAAGSSKHLNPGGWLQLEHGNDQGAPVAHLMQKYACHSIHCYTDLAGHARVSVCGFP